MAFHRGECCQAKTGKWPSKSFKFSAKTVHVDLLNALKLIFFYTAIRPLFPYERGKLQQAIRVCECF